MRKERSIEKFENKNPMVKKIIPTKISFRKSFESR